MSKSYTVIQRALLNSFKTNPLTTITKLKGVKTNTTNLIKTMIRMKDPEFEKLLPKFKQFYEETRTPSDKKTFESRFLKKLTNVDDVNFFESVYNKLNVDKAEIDINDRYPAEEKKNNSFFPKPKQFLPRPEPLPQPSGPPPRPPQEMPIDLAPDRRNRPRPEPQADRSHTELMDRLSDNTPNKSIRDLFNTTTQTYQDNKKLIDSVINSVNKQDGSWLTTIASLEFPELQIIQSVMNATPLGFNEADNANLQKIINNQVGNMSGSDYASVMGKLLVNPDALGKIIQGRASNSLSDAKNALSDWGNKIVGKKPGKSQEQQSIEDIVAGRISQTKTDAAKKEYINNAKGKTPQTQPEPKKPQGPDLGMGGRKPTGFAPLPTTSNLDKAGDLLTPPDIKNYGWKDPTVMEDVGRWFRGVLNLPKGIYTAEQYVQYLKQYNPELYKRYNDELNIYNVRASKVKLNADSVYDTKVGKNSIEGMISLLDKATLESGSLSNLSEDQISDIYDGIQMLKDVASGKRQDVSYSTLNLLSQSLFDELPRELRTKYRPELKAVNDYIEKDLRPNFEGDSELFKPINDTYDTPDEENPEETPTKPDETKPTDPTKPTEPETKPPEDPKEILGGVKVNERTMSSDVIGDLRPRLNWGGAVLKQTKAEVNYMNAFTDAMALDDVGWGNGKDNTLFNINNIDTERRYSNCFAMPKLPKPDPKPLSQNFREKQSIVWTPQNAPLDSYKHMRDNLDFGQYQNLSKRANLETTDPRDEIILNPNEFPAQVDKLTGGIPMKVKTNFNYINNQRFTKRR